MTGRSSRTRGVCESSFYVITHDNSKQVLDKLKRQGAQSFQELERLLTLIQKKIKDVALIKLLKEYQDKKELITSLHDLKQLVNETTFTKLIKDVFEWLPLLPWLLKPNKKFSL